MVRIDDLGAYAVALEVGQAPVDVAPAARVVAELAVAIVIGGARIGDIEPPRTAPVDDEVAPPVALDDARCPVPEGFRDAFVEIRRLLHV